MADLSDAEAAFVDAAIAALYPTGLDQQSAIGSPVRISRGWPLAGPMASDLAAGVANVSIFSVPGTGHNVTRWTPQSHVTPGACTLDVETSGSSVTFGGMGGIGQAAGLLVDGQAFVYRTAADDTATLVAAVLAEAVRAVRPCWLSAATLTVPQVSRLVGRVAADGMTLTEWSRQSQDIRLTAWCSSPAQRDQVCAILGAAFAKVSFLTLADGTSGRIRYRTSTTIDDHQDARQYRRDLIFEVEYGTSVETLSPAMLFGDLSLDGNSIYT